MIKRNGFTLAEVLITLGIVGIIASITIPQLVNSIDDIDNLGKFKKIFSEISQAVKIASFENGWNLNTSTTTGFLNELSKKMVFTKTGTWGSISTLPSGFYYSCYKAPNSTNQCGGWRRKPNNNGTIMGQTNSGAFILIRNASSTCTGLNYRVRLSTLDPAPKPNLCTEIEIDVNGDSPPNMIGKDYFLIVLIKENNQYLLYPSGFGTMACTPNLADNYNASLGCASIALKGGNMP